MRYAILAALALLSTTAQAQEVHALYEPNTGIVSCILIDPRANWQPPQGWEFDYKPNPDCTPSREFAQPSPVVSRMAFLQRFTPPEMLAISAAARSKDAVNVWLITAQAADQIDLSDDLTKQGINALVAAGIITQPRAVEILRP